MGWQIWDHLASIQRVSIILYIYFEYRKSGICCWFLVCHHVYLASTAATSGSEKADRKGLAGKRWPAFWKKHAGKQHRTVRHWNGHSKQTTAKHPQPIASLCVVLGASPGCHLQSSPRRDARPAWSASGPSLCGGLVVVESSPKDNLPSELYTA